MVTLNGALLYDVSGIMLAQHRMEKHYIIEYKHYIIASLEAESNIFGTDVTKTSGPG